MFLKKKEINKFKFSKVFFKRLFYFISFLFLLISISIVTLFFFSGFWKHNKNEIISRFDNYGLLNIKHTGEILSHIIRSPFYSKDKIYIDIKFEDQIKLNEVRKQKLKNLDSFGISKINSENKVHVNARIKYNKSQKYNSKIRIKGDRKIHYEDQDKTSYSINIKGDNKISGMNEFSIIKPRARNYLNEWIFHQLLDEAKLPYIRYEFITVYINGTSKGLYALEEGYTEQLTERNNLRYGPIFSIDEDLSDMSETTLPDLYNRKFWNKTKERKYLSDYANSKLLDFFQGNLELEEVMDIEKWSTYLAIIDISQSYHGAREKSVKFYYNPLTTKFEPIGFDAHYVKIKDQRLLSEKFSEDQMELPTFLRHFFDNEDFYLNYLKKLEKYSSTDFLYNFFNKRNDEIKKISSLIYSDYFLNDYVFFFGPGIYYFNKERFFERSKYISNYLIFNKKKVSYFYLNEEYFIINNNSMKYLKLSSLKCNSNTEIKKISINHVLYKQNLNNITNLVTNHNCNQIMIKNINEKEFKFNLLNHSDYNRKNEIDKNAYKNIFDVNENEKIIKLKNKSAKITKNIYLPKSFKFQLKPGDKLEIKNNAFIFSESHWESLGNIDSPIIIYGKENNYGGGIYIIWNKLYK